MKPIVTYVFVLVCAYQVHMTPVCAQIIINEICTDPQADWSGGGWISDGGGSITGTDEYVELFNAGSGTVDVSGWMIECTDSQRDTQVIDSALIKNGGIRIAPGGFAVLGNIRGEMNNSVQVCLYDAAGTLADRAVLGNFDDGITDDNGPDGNSDSTGTAAGRDRFGRDTGIDSADFLTVFASPGIRNRYRTDGTLQADKQVCIGLSDALRLILCDRDRDLASANDRCTVSVRSLCGGDEQTLTLVEREMHGGVFEGTLYFSELVGSAGRIGVNSDGDTVLVLAVDPVYGDTSVASAVWMPPVDTGRIIVSEVMANAYGSESDNEWIEIQNAGTNTVRMRGWSLFVNASAVPFPDTLALAPGAYCVLVRQLTDSDGDEESFEIAWGDGSGIWGDDEAERYDAVQVSFPTLLNGGATVSVAGGYGYLDSIRWTADAGNGMSWERCRPERSELNVCTDAAGGTPGGRNSVTPFAVDCALVAGSVMMATVDSSGSEVSVRINNEGMENAGTEVSFYDATGNLIGTAATGLLLPGDTATASVRWDTAATCEYSLTVVLTPDDDPRDDTLKATVLLQGRIATGLIVNEIMFAPVTDIGTEWMEVCNVGASAVDVTGWSCGDADGGNCFDSAAVIRPGGYAVLVQNRNTFRERYPAVTCPVIAAAPWEVLSNEKDAIVLRDRFGRVTASCAYEKEWMGDAAGTNGISLERISGAGGDADPGNWWACVASAGATPGLANSVTAPGNAGPVRIQARPDPFSPDGDGYDDITEICIRVPRRSYVTVELFDVRGRPLITFCKEQPCTGSYTFSWAGNGTACGRLDIGIYILYLEARDAVAGTVTRRKTTVVVARRLN